MDRKKSVSLDNWLKRHEYQPEILLYKDYARSNLRRHN